MQVSDVTLAPLWELARRHEKQFFIVNDLLMCVSSTLNTVSSALVVPQDLRHKILVAAHDGLGHGGVNVTRTLINKHFTWPKMLNDIRSYIQGCPKCQKFTKSSNTKVPLVEPEVISERGEKIAIDIVGPLPKAKGNYRFIFTCMEIASGYPFVIPIRILPNVCSISFHSLAFLSIFYLIRVRIFFPALSLIYVENLVFTKFRLPLTTPSRMGD